MANTDGASQPSHPTSGNTAIREPTSPEAGTFAVLKASHKPASDQESTLVNHRPPPRSRRRRTSPEDQVVLEAEFQRNPKPLKEKKREIVSRVSLGEKEVQIWFQNRRQIERRKSGAPPKPEYSPSIPDRSPTVTPGSSHLKAFSPVNQSINGEENKDAAVQSTYAVDVGAESKVESNIQEKNLVVKEMPLLEGQMESDLITRSVGQLHTSNGASCSNLPTSTTSLHASCSESQKSTATQEMSAASMSDTSSVARAQTATGLPPPLIKRQSSSLRLSTSVDGKARIVVDNGSSPPRPTNDTVPKLARPPQLLQRSQSEFASPRPSAASFGDLMPVPRRLAPSRSRDARTWEFYCDSDARNALTVQAENQEKGKAETTIGLIRSSSSSKKIVPLPMPTTALAKRKVSGDKSHSRPKLARTESSLARLQNASPNTKPRPRQLDDSSKKAYPQPTLTVELSGDLSDKENWVPGTRRRHVRSPRPESEMRSRSTLGENSEIPTHSNGLESHLQRDMGRPGRRMGTPTGKENDEPRDLEVAAFMGVAPVPRVAEDLDCVQQLLSLSQGAWS